MKRVIIISFYIFSLIFIFVFSSINASAEENCYWGYLAGAGTYAKGCVRPSIESDEKKCAGKERPASAPESIKDFACCCTTNAVQNESQSTLFEAPDIKITIPGMEKLSDINCAPGDTCEIPWLGQYIQGIYNYAIAAAGILAAVVLMGGGLLWLLSRGEASKITKAKELIFGSIIGLIILTGSYLILTIINPNLVNLQNIEVVSIKMVSLGGDSNTPEVTQAMNTSQIAEKLGINCGKDSLSEMVAKSKGKISYSQKLKTKFSSDGFVYLDCSSYTHFLLKCSANKNTHGYSGGIFADQVVWNEKSDWLNVGDLIGWKKENSNRTDKEGHVFIYLGNNKFADCHGTKTPGGCVGNFSSEQVLKYADSHSDGKLYFKRY